MSYGPDVVVLGAGAAGLFCAAEAARRGRRVVVVDHAPEPGRKIMVSGGGRCNFTNLHAGPEAYASENPSFCASALAGFGPADFVRIVEEHGIPYFEKTRGQLFCDRTAGDIRDMLAAGCRDAGVELALGRAVTDVRREPAGFRVETGLGPLISPRLVVATGGMSAPETGATGFGLDLARRFGLNVVEPAPALAGLRWREPDRARWAGLSGISLPDVAVSCRGHRSREALLFTHTGLSGPAILDASLHWRPGSLVEIDLLPDRDLAAELAVMRAKRGAARAEEALPAGWPKRFAREFVSGRLPTAPVARIPDTGLAEVANAVKAWRIEPTATEGWERAEVMRGGVDTRELSSKTMEARSVPGLFFVGEVVDVTGQLGGFNLHWAWASAFAAGSAL